MQGVFTRVVAMQGFAFILGDDGITRFTHVNYMIPEDDWRYVRKGVRVSFDPIDASSNSNTDRQRAINVVLLERPRVATFYEKRIDNILNRMADAEIDVLAIKAMIMELITDVLNNR